MGAGSLALAGRQAVPGWGEACRKPSAPPSPQLLWVQLAPMCEVDRADGRAMTTQKATTAAAPCSAPAPSCLQAAQLGVCRVRDCGGRIVCPCPLPADSGAQVRQCSFCQSRTCVGSRLPSTALWASDVMPREHCCPEFAPRYHSCGSIGSV